MNMQKNIDVFKGKQDLLGICCYDRNGFSWHIEKLKAVSVIWYFLSTNEKYSSIPFSEIEQRFIDKVDNRNLCLLYDQQNTNLPRALITWDDDFNFDTHISEDYDSTKSNTHLKIRDMMFANNLNEFNWMYRLMATRVFPDYDSCSLDSPLSKETSKIRSFKRHTKSLNLNIVDKSAQPNEEITYTEQVEYLHPFRKTGSTPLELSEKLISSLNLNENSRVLLCGAETFTLGLDLAKNLKCNVVIYDEEALNLTRVAELAAEKKLQAPQFEIRHGSDANIPYGIDSFDCVISLGFLSRQMHFEYALCEMIRVLKTDSKLCLLELDDYQVDSTFKMPSQRLIEVQNLYKKLDIKITKELEQEPQQSILDYYHYYDKKFPNEHVQKPSLKVFNKCGRQGNQAKPVYKPKATIVTFSGGIDSTYVLWKMLTETDDDIIALHLDIVNSEQRHLAEKIVSKTIIEYLSSIHRPIKLMECSVNHSNFHWYGYDIMSVGFEVGMAATSHLIETNKHVDRWTMGSCLEEGGWFKRWRHMANCVSANCYPHKAPHYFELPIITKREQIELMPPELVSMTWYCRHPVITRDGFQVCGTCKTCGVMKESGF